MKSNDQVMSFSFKGDKYSINVVTDYNLLEKIYCLRYQAYVVERHCCIKETDHQSRQVKDQWDDHAVIFALIKNDTELIGTARGVYCYKLSPQILSLNYLYDFKQFTHLHHNAFSIFTYVILDKKYRNKGIFLIRFIEAIFRHAAYNNIHFIYANANDHLLKLWKRFGYRDYKGKIYTEDFGCVTPMYMLMNDITHFRSVRSPLLNAAIEEVNNATELEMVV